jgi:D-tyrosyl-tRNA(Tyr) deacylase
MRALLQRVTTASVTIESVQVAHIQRGLLILLGIETTDTPEDLDWLAIKITTLRLFPDAETPWSKSVTEIAGDLLLVSQFTLHASTKKGTKPSWHRAAKPDQAIPLYEAMHTKLTALLGRPVPAGRFGAMMQVSLTNDGPVTILLDSKNRE